MTAYSYVCRGSIGTKRSRSGAHDKLISAVAEREGIDFDEALCDAWSYRDVPLMKRPRGLELDKKLLSGDTIVMSMADLLTFDTDDNGGEQRSIEHAIDVLATWLGRGVRVVVAEIPSSIPEGKLAEAVKLMAKVQKAWRSEQGNVPPDLAE